MSTPPTLLVGSGTLFLYVGRYRELVPAYPSCPGKRAVKRVCARARACVRACVYLMVELRWQVS